MQKVCENLLRRGPLTLQLLIRFTELTPLQVKNSLLILIQHNCVQAFSIEQIGTLSILIILNLRDFFIFCFFFKNRMKNNKVLCFSFKFYSFLF